MKLCIQLQNLLKKSCQKINEEVSKGKSTTSLNKNVVSLFKKNEVSFERK
jgi:hypothetical protein